MTKICIRQPGYLPSLGFFKKIESADYFVFLDDGEKLFDRPKKISISTIEIKCI